MIRGDQLSISGLTCINKDRKLWGKVTNTKFYRKLKRGQEGKGTSSQTSFQRIFRYSCEFNSIEQGRGISYWQKDRWGLHGIRTYFFLFLELNINACSVRKLRFWGLVLHSDITIAVKSKAFPKTMGLWLAVKTNILVLLECSTEAGSLRFNNLVVEDDSGTVMVFEEETSLILRAKITKFWYFKGVGLLFYLDLKSTKSWIS